MSKEGIAKESGVRGIVEGMPEGVRDAKPYVAGKAIGDLIRERGLDEGVQIVELASNENPIGPSQRAIDGIQNVLSTLHQYPDSEGLELKVRLGEVLHCAPSRIVLGNGTESLLDLLMRTFVKPGDEVVVPEFSSPQFAEIAQLAGAIVHRASAGERFALSLKSLRHTISPRTRIVVIGNPESPSGGLLTEGDLFSLAEHLPQGCLLVVDESYHGLVTDQHYCSTLSGHAPLNDGHRPIVTTRTFSKGYGLAGLRVAYAVMPESLCAFVNKVRRPFNVGTLAQAGALAALDDTDHLSLALSVVRSGKAFLVRECRHLGLDVIEGAANFILVGTAPRRASEVANQLLDFGIIVRPLGYPKMHHYMRVSVGLEDENEAFIKGMRILMQ